MVKIVPGREDLIPSFYKALKTVANEKIYIEMIEPPPIDKVTNFQMKLIENNGVVFYAVDGANVVGWCDVFPFENERLCHRGMLGMGVTPEFRGKGLGTQLMDETIIKCRKTTLEKLELTVYDSNKSAIGLYEKFGFQKEGYIKHYRKLDGKYFDVHQMGLFL